MKRNCLGSIRPLITPTNAIAHDALAENRARFHQESSATGEFFSSSDFGALERAEKEIDGHERKLYERKKKGKFASKKSCLVGIVRWSWGHWQLGLD
jgi:hypothetical protein